MTVPEWPITELGAGLSVKHGFAFKGEFFRDSGDLIVLTPGNFFEAGGFKLKSKEKFYDGPVPEGYLLRRGDVVVAMTEQSKGLLGSTATIPADETFLHNQRLGLLQVTDPGLLGLRYCYHLLNSPDARNQIQAAATGSKVRHTAPERIQSIRVALPDLEYQRKVAGALDSIESSIENNRRRIEILEEMARLIYREWFVHFRFPDHEDVELVDSDLGPIPEGWEIAAVDDVSELVRGRSYRRADVVDEPDGQPFLNLKCIDRGGGFRKSGLKRYDGPFKQEQLALPGDTVIAVTDMTQERNIVAQAGRVPNLPEGSGVISLDLVRLVPRREMIDADYLYGTFRYSTFSDEVKEHANGTNVLHLSPDRIREYRFAVAPVETQRAFRGLVRPMYDLVDNLQVQSEMLAEARDLLLPRLISGELDVSDLDLNLEPVL